MMKLITKFLIFFACALCLSTEVYAASSCPNSVKKELATKATYVKTDYEVIDNSIENEIQADKEVTTYKIPNYSFEISIYNISPDLFVTIQDNITNETKTITNTDTIDGTYTFTNDDFGTIYNYIILIKSADSNCYGDTLKTLKFTKPRYNAYSEYTYCKNSSSFYCQRFVGQEPGIKSSSDFLKKISANNDSNKEEVSENSIIVESIKKNWTIYVLIFVSTIFIVGVIFFLIDRKKRKEIDF